MMIMKTASCYGYATRKELALRFIRSFSDMEALLGHVIWMGYGMAKVQCEWNGKLGTT